MQLSKRLSTVADLITRNSRVADVGCDHAYIPIYLIEKGISPYVIAMDVNKGPTIRARDNVIRYGMEEKIDIRLSDGLKELKPSEVDTILIAGMGGSLTVRILSGKPEVVENVNELILQPQSEIHLVRGILNQIHFLITAEDMVKEDGKFYFMIKAEKDSQIKDKQKYQLIGKEHFYYGRQLLEQKNEILHEFLLKELQLCQNIKQELSYNQTEKSQERALELIEKEDLIQKALKYYND